ncbi:patatin-like phospholipase family protein [Chloroflexota bacterium]
MTSNKDKKKVGLALSSGVAKGLAHIGVLKVLEREKIPVDMIAGTSVGALIGALYARGDKVSEIQDRAKKVGSKRLSYLTDFSLPKTGLLRGKRIDDTLKSFYGDMKFVDLKIPFTCVATDIDSGDEVVINEGILWQAIRASISLPVILAVAKWKDRYLVDGALVNPVPVDILKEMGADIVIAVNVIPEKHAKEQVSEPSIFEVVMQTLHIVGFHAINTSIEGADVLIEPDMGSISFTDLHKVEESVQLGEEAAEKVLPEIKRLVQ